MALKFLACAIVLVGVAGCSVLPSAGPTATAVLDESMKAKTMEARYNIVPVNDQVLSILGGRRSDATLASFGGRQGKSADTRVGIGDAVSLTIWEAGSGGLFSAAGVIPGAIGATSSGSRAATIPDQVVGRDGTIMVPYAGRIKVSGRSTFDIQGEIERALEGKAVQPQVLASVTRPVSNTVTVIGEATAGARIPLSPKGDRVLDIIASAGGARTPTSETFIQLTRGGRTVRVAMTRVASDSRENIFVQPGDVITVIRDPQFFMAYGATGRSAEINFEGEIITLAQGLTKAGGLLDNRANPEGVFLFRLETLAVARELGLDTTNSRIGDRVKVVYHVNMRDPNGFFLVSQMRMFNRDLIYVSNAPISDVQKVMQLFNMVASPVAQGANIATAF